MKLYFVANARMPSEKAHAIQIAKMCEAFAEQGHEVVLVVPARGTGNIKDYYRLRVEVPVVRLPSLLFGQYERTGFALMALSFMLAALGFLWGKRLTGERFLIYTVDIDTFSHILLPLGGRVVAEMHSPKRSTVLSRFFFKRATIIATNPLIAEELLKTFGVEPLVEPNGVDETFFNLSGRGGGALYVGRLYAWKGLEVLPAAGIPIQVLGGAKGEFEQLFGPAGNLRFAEARPYEVPQWIAKADVLLLVGTAKNEESSRYTSPMKVFEYLATGKPVVASATEALRSIIPDGLVRYCPPDNAGALAHAVNEARREPGDAHARVAFARQHTWHKRAERVLAFSSLSVDNTTHA